MSDSRTLANHEQSGRNLSFDCLKICAMMMVTFLHITGHGLKGVNLVPLSGTYWFVLLANTFSIVAVNCFVLITGYFLSTGTVKPKKLFMLWLQVWMYSVGTYLCLCAIPGTGVGFSFKQLVRCGLPILTKQYWFFTCYVLLYLTAPILNILICGLSKEMYQKVLLLLLIIFSGIPAINFFGDVFGTNGGIQSDMVCRFIFGCRLY